MNIWIQRNDNVFVSFRNYDGSFLTPKVFLSSSEDVIEPVVLNEAEQYQLAEIASNPILRFTFSEIMEVIGSDSELILRFYESLKNHYTVIYRDALKNAIEDYINTKVKNVFNMTNVAAYYVDIEGLIYLLLCNAEIDHFETDEHIVFIDQQLKEVDETLYQIFKNYETV